MMDKDRIRSLQSYSPSQCRIAPSLVCTLLLIMFLFVSGSREGAWAIPAADSRLFLPLVSAPPARLLLAAAHIDSALSGEGDEALLLWNVGVYAQPLAGWRLSTQSRTATFPLTTTLTIQPGARLWCAAEAATFRQTFGAAPQCEWATDTEPDAVDLIGGLTLANNGGLIQLSTPGGDVMDTLIYGAEAQPAMGWQGAPAQLYTRGDMPSVGQVWHRKLDPSTLLPLDTDRATDWAGDLADLDWGRRVRLAGWGGWGADDLYLPPLTAADATVTVLVGPEGLFQPLAAQLAAATTSIDLAGYTFEHPALAEALAAAARRGVRVRMLLEGSPAGGFKDLQKWCLAQIVEAGGDVRFFAAADHAPKGYRPRYRFAHAKYLIIDDRLALNGTENFSYDAFPIDTSAPVGGRRGYYLATDAPPVVVALKQLFDTDWAPDRFPDVRSFEVGHERYGGPPADYVAPPPPAHVVAESPFGAPQIVTGMARFQVLSAPENALHPEAGLLSLFGRAGADDEIYLEQLYEHKHWGATNSNPIADPNPRLMALIAAARRGATVRLLLDSFFDDPQSLRNNRATIAYLNDLAAAEGLDLEARIGNPAAAGIHAKLALVRVGNEQWSAVGSLNGGETSHKLNREVVLLTDMAGVYDRLREVFAWDWARSG